MIAKTLEELLVHQRAEDLWDAVNAILQHPRLRQDLRLLGQLADAADSVVSNISEGFEQPTDKAFARYLYTAKASAAEVRTRLRLAAKRGYVPSDESEKARALAEETARMCVGLIKYLVRATGRPAAWDG